MMRKLMVAAFLLSLGAPLAAQAPSALKMRIDKSTEASDPDDVPNVTLSTVGRGFQVNTGPAAVVWEPAHTASGAYTLRGKFTLQKPSGHTNYYGLVFGGRDLADAKQAYVYFLVAQDGTFLVKHRNGEDVRDVVAKTRHASVVRPNEAGT